MGSDKKREPRWLAIALVGSLVTGCGVIAGLTDVPEPAPGVTDGADGGGPVEGASDACPSGHCACGPGFTGSPSTGCTPSTDGAAEAGPLAKSCTPNPCLNGGVCGPTDGGSSCTCPLGYSGATCEIAAGRYCDVVYRFDTATPSAQATFRVANTGSQTTDSTYVIGDNTTPMPNGLVTPLTPADFPRGFMRLRFTEVEGAPAAGPVDFMEFFLPAQFTVSVLGTNVVTNVQYSTGLLKMATSGCPTADYPECLAAPTVQTLDRVCKSHGSGVLTGTTLAWNACALSPPAPPAKNPSSIAAWTNDQSQIPAPLLFANPGCIEAVSAFGAVTCNGTFCWVVPKSALVNQNATYEQKWNDFTFSSTDYATATVGMARSTLPSPGGTYAGVDWGAAVPIKVACGTAAELTCDVQ